MTPLTGPELLGVVRDAVALVCEVDPAQLCADTALVADLAADSLALVEIVEVTEAALSSTGSAVVFDDARLDELATIGDLVAYVVSYPAARTMAVT